MRCPHCDATSAELTAEQHASFLSGELAPDLSVLVCQECWLSFKNNVKDFEWGGRITVMTLRKPQPVAKQPLDDVW